MATSPEMFTPVPGGWGRQGSTHVRLAAADAATLRNALTMAWTNRMPKKRKAEYANAHPAPTKSVPTKKKIGRKEK
jgi:hypothetical protein